MIVASDWAGKTFAVLGLARSGAATVSALLASGAKVVAWDSDLAKREAFAAHDGLSIAPLDDMPGFDALVVSPGVPLNTHPLAAAARAVGVPVIGDIELFAQARKNLPPHKVVGITGTNGKSTTTALVHHILKTAGVPSLMGGNIGLPILGQEPLPEGGVYVLELSSYQIDLTRSLDCDVAVLLNITPDHLDRYDGFAGYAASKARLFAMQSAGHVAVVGTADVASANIAQGLAGRADDLVMIASDTALGPPTRSPPRPGDRRQAHSQCRASRSTVAKSDPATCSSRCWARRPMAIASSTRPLRKGP